MCIIMHINSQCICILYVHFGWLDFNSACKGVGLGTDLKAKCHITMHLRHGMAIIFADRCLYLLTMLKHRV